MKFIYSLFLLLIPLLTFSQEELRERVEIKTSKFEIIYSETLEQPLIVKYLVECQYGSHAYSRRGLRFYKVDSVHTSDNKDYYKNVWDKGHLIPAAAYSCDEKMLKSTFTYLNCALQHQDLNRKHWKYLEAYEKKLTRYGDVSVVVEVIFNEYSKVLPTGATVPSHFVKTIYLDNKKVGKWKFPNEGVTGNVNDFKILN